MNMKIFLCVFGGIWLLVCLPFAGVGVRQMRAYRHLSATGQPATGIVVSKVVRHGSSTRSMSASRSYKVSTSITINNVRQARIAYEFTDERGARQEGQSGLMPAGDAGQWTAGQRAYVKYDREKPSSSVWLGADAE